MNVFKIFDYYSNITVILSLHYHIMSESRAERIFETIKAFCFSEENKEQHEEATRCSCQDPPPEQQQEEQPEEEEHEEEEEQQEEEEQEETLSDPQEEEQEEESYNEEEQEEESRTAHVLNVYHHSKAKSKRAKNNEEYTEAYKMLEQIESNKLPFHPAIIELKAWLAHKIDETSKPNQPRWFEPVRYIREQLYSRIYGNWLIISKKTTVIPELTRFVANGDIHVCSNMKSVVKRLEKYSAKYKDLINKYIQKQWDNIKEAIEEAVEIQKEILK